MNRQEGMKLATLLVAAFMLIGAAGLLRSEPDLAPSKLLGGAAAVVSGSMMNRLYMDVPGGRQGLGETLLSSRKAASDEAIAEKPEATTEATDKATAEESEAALPATVPETKDESGDETETIKTPNTAEAEPSETATADSPNSQVSILEAPADRKLAFIYHSHNRESWLPELKGTGKDEPNEAFDSKKNVSLLGARLKEQLEAHGIGAIHSGTDYNTAVKNFNYNYSYKYSKTTVKEALAVHDELTYLIDIHRDSARRKQTTIEINGKSYAKMYFIVGQGHANWKENEALAKKIHEAMEDKLPGISKGILTKGTKHGHGEYNQSLSPGSLLIEVGGIDNTLEESNRTIDALAAVFAEMLKDAVKVQANGEALAPEQS